LRSGDSFCRKLALKVLNFKKQLSKESMTVFRNTIIGNMSPTAQPKLLPNGKGEA
jgi:hypothetical protein